MTADEFMASINPEPLTKNSLTYDELSQLALWLNEEIDRAKNSKKGDSNEGSN